MDAKRKMRLVQVRQQSKDFAQQVRCDVKLEKEKQLKRVLATRQLELDAWKLKTQNDLRRQYGQCSEQFGNAHLNACDASCEVSESILCQREEFDLLAAERGRTAMLQEHRKREREAEQRLQQKKRKRQRDAITQADLISTRDIAVNVDTLMTQDDGEEASENEIPEVHPVRVVRQNQDKVSSDADSDCIIVESSSAPSEMSSDESEFNQITNILKQKSFKPARDGQKGNLRFAEKVIDVPAGRKTPDKILKSSLKRQPTATSYDLVQNLVAKHKKPVSVEKRDVNSREPVSKNILGRLDEITSNASMEKENERRNYEALRKELEEALAEENKAKQAAARALESITTNNLSKLEKAREQKMNNALKNSLKRNIQKCPLVDSKNKNGTKPPEVNVGASDAQASNTSQHSPTIASTEKTDFEVERLKHLLEQINHYRKKLLCDIEGSRDIPGTDWKKVTKCLEDVLKEKSPSLPLPPQNHKKDMEPLSQEPERDKHEKRLKIGVRQKNDDHQAKSVSSEDSDLASLVEIIIKVHPKLGAKKNRKAIRCSTEVEETREPKEVPRQKPEKESIPEPAPTQKVAKIPEKITKEKSKPPIVVEEPVHQIEESSCSTTYKSLPKRISLSPTRKSEENGKAHHKLNSELMRYITRLLGMNVNLKNGLSASVSTVTTPGSGTINTSGNRSSNASAPHFDTDRLERLQEFINDNYSFLGEVNEALDRSEDRQTERSSQMKLIWLETLSEKKMQSKAITTGTEKTVSKSSEPAREQRPPRSETSKAPKSKSSRPSTEHTEPQQSVQQLPRQDSVQITSRDMVDVTKHLENHILKNLTEYTSNCHKRIDEIAQMMERVRKEKLKLIENSLSSGEFGQFTEYREIVGTLKPGEAAPSTNDPKESSSQREDPPSEEINNILHKQTRPFGVSKDSGISILSRPMTSSDFRDSPDVRVPEESENTFQPILKDIPKITHTRSTEDNVSSIDKSSQVSNKEQDEKAQKKAQKPPLSLNRFSPHEPHELSTIAEVETPSASKVNLLLNVESIEPFPSFTAYEKNQQPQKEQSSHDFMNLDDFGKAINEIALKSFHRLPEYGINESNARPNETIESSSSSSSSVVDIMEELKRRNIMTEPFKYIESSVTEIRPFPSELPAVELTQTPDRADLTMKSQDDLELTRSRSNTLSGIQEIDVQDSTPNLEKDLEDSTNEAESPEDAKKRRETSSSDHSLSSTSGQPMNLKEFLSRELTEHYKAKADKSSNESSLSSQFMRSLLNVASKRSSSASTSSDREHLRTSTPVYRSASKTREDTRLGASISTVKFSEEDSTGKSSQSDSKK